MLADLPNSTERGIIWALANALEEHCREGRPDGTILYHSCMTYGEHSFQFLAECGLLEDYKAAGEWTDAGRKMLAEWEADYRLLMESAAGPTALSSLATTALHHTLFFFFQFGWWRPDDPRKPVMPAYDAAAQLLVHLGLMRRKDAGVVWAHNEDWEFTPTGHEILYHDDAPSSHAWSLP